MAALSQQFNAAARGTQDGHTGHYRGKSMCGCQLVSDNRGFYETRHELIEMLTKEPPTGRNQTNNNHHTKRKTKPKLNTPKK